MSRFFCVLIVLVVLSGCGRSNRQEYDPKGLSDLLNDKNFGLKLEQRLSFCACDIDITDSMQFLSGQTDIEFVYNDLDNEILVFDQPFNFSNAKLSAVLRYFTETYRLNVAVYDSMVVIRASAESKIQRN